MMTFVRHLRNSFHVRLLLVIAITLLLGAAATGAVLASHEGLRQSGAAVVLGVLAGNALAAVIAGLAVSALTRRGLLAPIAELARAAERLAGGAAASPVAVGPFDELRALVCSFNQMAEHFRSTTVSRDQMDNIIMSMRDALLIASPSGSISRANAAACFLLGYGEAELIGTPLDRYIRDAADEAKGTVAEVLESSSISGREKSCLVRSGRSVPVLFSASVMRDGGGEAQGIVCVVRDITQLKQAEARLQNYSADLQAVNEELKSFAYIVSHDLRAPLVNIRGFSDELGRSFADLESCFAKHQEALPPEERKRIGPLFRQDIPEALSFIRSSVARMDNQISAILKLSRAGRRKLSPEPLRTGEFVRGLLTTLTHQIESRNVVVTVGELPDIVADRTAMEQVFGNLLDNAVKYLDPERPGAIAVTAEERDGETVFRVQDNGRGIAHEDIPKAFELFRRVGRQDVAGEGMGLAYVKALVRSMGGRIWCQSEPGSGTTFHITVPRERTAASLGRACGLCRSRHLRDACRAGRRRRSGAAGVLPLLPGRHRVGTGRRRPAPEDRKDHA
jgi:PAS domain S-box-containing protein